MKKKKLRKLLRQYFATRQDRLVLEKSMAAWNAARRKLISIDTARIPQADNLTPRAHSLLAGAADIADEHGSVAVSCDHIFAAMIRMDKGGAGYVLSQRGVTEDMLREFLSASPLNKAATHQSGAAQPTQNFHPGPLTSTSAPSVPSPDPENASPALQRILQAHHRAEEELREVALQCAQKHASPQQVPTAPTPTVSQSYSHPCPHCGKRVPGLQVPLFDDVWADLPPVAEGL